MWHYLYLILKIEEERNVNWMTNEVLFYGGIGITGGSLLFGIIYLCVSKVKSVRLNAQLDSEYGEKK